MSKQCCCGRYDLDEPLNINGKIHEPIGQIGNFCGPESAHYIRDLRAQLTSALAERDEARGELSKATAELTILRVEMARHSAKNSKLVFGGVERKWVEHNLCSGSREHVISWDNQGQRCSEPNCIINKERDRLATQLDTAWQQGAEAMREAAARLYENSPLAGCHVQADLVAAHIRALSVPPRP